MAKKGKRQESRITGFDYAGQKRAYSEEGFEEVGERVRTAVSKKLMFDSRKWRKARQFLQELRRRQRNRIASERQINRITIAKQRAITTELAFQKRQLFLAFTFPGFMPLRLKNLERVQFLVAQLGKHHGRIRYSFSRLKQFKKEWSNLQQKLSIRLDYKIELIAYEESLRVFKSKVLEGQSFPNRLAKDIDTSSYPNQHAAYQGRYSDQSGPWD